MRHARVIAAVAVTSLFGLTSVLAGEGSSRWDSVPVGTVLELSVVKEVSAGMTDAERAKSLKRTETREVWKVVAKDETTLTLEKTVDGATTRATSALPPAEPLPAEPSGTGAAGPVGTGKPEWGGRETVTTPAGTYACTVVVRRTTQLESGSERREWWAPGVPVPVKETLHAAGGAGHVTIEDTTRTLVRYAPPGVAESAAAPVSSGSAWSRCPVGTVLEVEVERKVTTRGKAEAPTTWRETTTVRRHSGARVVVEVKDRDGAREVELDAADPVAPTPGSTGDKHDHWKTTVDQVKLTVALGTFDCAHVRKIHSMNEADGSDEEWRAAGVPVPVQTRSEWRAKQTETVTTRTLVRFDRPK